MTGAAIVHTSGRGGPGTLNLFWQRADGTGDVQRLTESKNNQLAGSWHPSGKFLAFTEVNPRTSQDIMIVRVDGDETSGWKVEKPMAFQNSQFVEQEPMFSPDGRWLAYMSNASGQAEVYVRPFPGPGGLQQISTDGGGFPTWSRSKPELFYVNFPRQQIMVASYASAGDSFQADKPRPWSTGRFLPRPRLRPFALHPDGQRFALAAFQTQKQLASRTSSCSSSTSSTS